MSRSEGNWTKWKLKRIANETAELPGVRWVTQPLYRKIFRQRHRSGNSYFGIFQTYEAAKAAAPPAFPSTYDFADAGKMYHDQHDKIRVSDYPLVYWLQRLLDQGERRIFDLGGHIGVSYYGFGRYLKYPTDMRWQVHDVPAVMEAGRQWAAEHDPGKSLHFAASRDEAEGSDVLMTSGALQYLEYTLPDMLATLRSKPRHVLVNLVPMHPTRSYFTLQNIGKAVLPYRVMAVPEFIAAMEALGYVKQDEWHSAERHLRVPFEPAYDVEDYSGFHFRLGGS